MIAGRESVYAAKHGKGATMHRVFVCAVKSVCCKIKCLQKTAESDAYMGQKRS